MNLSSPFNNADADFSMLVHTDGQPLSIVRGFIESLFEQILQNTRLRPLSEDVNRLVAAIHQKALEPDLSVKTLKVYCNLRNNNIASVFKQEVGISIKHYVELLRMRATELLLQRSALSIIAISWIVGYEHSGAFYRAFARRFHSTPGAYRKRYSKFVDKALCALSGPGEKSMRVLDADER